MAEGDVERVLVEPGSDDPGNELDATAGVEPDPDDRTAEHADAPRQGGCRTERRGWAGGHLHGAVRPRRRPVGRGRPPGRWC